MKRLVEINSIIDRIKSEITDESIKTKLENLKPKRNFLNKLNKKDITYDEYNYIISQITHEIYPEINKKYPFSIIHSQELNFNLTYALITFYNLHYSLEFYDQKTKLYPISLDLKTAEELYQNELMNIIQRHIKTNQNYDDIIKERIISYQERIDFYKKTLKENEMLPYYGSPKFMYERADYINECLKRLPFETINFDSLLSDMKAFAEKYPEINSSFFYNRYPYYNKTYKTEYKAFEENYLKLLNYENTLMPQISKIWQKYLINHHDHHDNSFKYIIHTFSENLVPPNEMKKACCSLASERLLTTPYGTCGLIYDFTPESVDTICAEDAGSWTVDKETFIERNLPLNWQLTDNKVFYENPKISKLILPGYLETSGIAKNIIYNQEPLNYTNYCAYTEIYLNNKAQAIGVFYTDACQNIDEIKAYAQKYNLPLIHLSLIKLRTNANLNPIAIPIEPEKESKTR